MYEIYDKCGPTVVLCSQTAFFLLQGKKLSGYTRLVQQWAVYALSEDRISLSFTVKPDGQAQIVPNQSVKASYATVRKSFYIIDLTCTHIHTYTQVKWKSVVSSTCCKCV